MGWPPAIQILRGEGRTYARWSVPPEWIDDLDSIEAPSVLEVFGVEHAAAGRAGRPNDHRVPDRELVSTTYGAVKVLVTAPGLTAGVALVGRPQHLEIAASSAGPGWVPTGRR